MSLKLVVLAIALFAATVSARRFCTVDDDCMDLGDVTCQYSLCGSWGICGCKRGYVARFMGSSMKFQCHLLKKIEESCSEDGQGGVCGPDNSFCDGGWCKCNSGMIAGWDGEKCFSSYELSDHYGETCSASLGNCASAGGTCTKGTGFSTQPHNYEMNVCACGIGQRLEIPNMFDASPFVGRREPMCIALKVGDKCMRDSDCSTNDANSECVNSVCACSANFKAYANGACIADSTTLLSQGAICQSTTTTVTGVCGLNMQCGDICTPDSYYDGDVDKTCECNMGYTGSSCTAITEGSACTGDAQCTGIAIDALCLDGACVAGAAGITFSLFSMLFAVLALLL